MLPIEPCKYDYRWINIAENGGGAVVRLDIYPIANPTCSLPCVASIYLGRADSLAQQAAEFDAIHTMKLERGSVKFARFVKRVRKALGFTYAV